MKRRQVEVKRRGKVVILRFYKHETYEPERKPSVKRLLRRLRTFFPCRAQEITADRLEDLILETFGDYEYHVLISDERFRIITKEQMEQLIKEDDTDTLPYIPIYADCEIPAETAYALGVFFADGTCGFRGETACGAWWRIVGEKELLEKAKAGLEAYPRFPVYFRLNLFNSYRKGTETNYGRRNRDEWCLDVYAKKYGARRDFIRAFYRMFYLDGILDYKKVPGCIYDSSLEAKKAFLQGVIDGDGDEYNRLTVVGDLALTGIIKLMMDLHWAFSICKDPRTKRDDVYCINYGTQREPRAWFLDALDKLGGMEKWVPLKAISERTGYSISKVMRLADKLEEKGYILSKKPWRQRRLVKLAHPFNLCDDFSDVLLGALTRKTWQQGFAIGQLWYYTSTFGHAQNLFSDGEIIYVLEPQNDGIMTWSDIKGKYPDARAFMVKF